jgi:hypothetical protein
LYLALDFGDFARTPRYFQIVEILKIEPEFSIRMEKSRESQGGLWGNPPAFVDNFTNASGRDMQFEREFIDSQPKRLHKVLPKDFTWMDHGHQRAQLAYPFYRSPHRDSEPS